MTCLILSLTPDRDTTANLTDGEIEREGDLVVRMTGVIRSSDHSEGRQTNSGNDRNVKTKQPPQPPHHTTPRHLQPTGSLRKWSPPILNIYHRQSVSHVNSTRTRDILAMGENTMNKPLTFIARVLRG